EVASSFELCSGSYLWTLGHSSGSKTLGACLGVGPQLAHSAACVGPPVSGRDDRGPLKYMYYVGCDYIHPDKIDKQEKDEEEKRRFVVNFFTPVTGSLDDLDV